jgi:hypothetical protein
MVIRQAKTQSDSGFGFEPHRCLLLLAQLGNFSENGFVKKNVRNRDQTAAVASFDKGTPVTLGCLAIKLHQGFTSNQTALMTGLQNATFTSGGTPLWNVVYDATELLSTQSSQNLRLS